MRETARAQRGGIARWVGIIVLAALHGLGIYAYDDLGIAFGIAVATETHRPPLGAVDWVAVFAPGSASRIFPQF